MATLIRRGSIWYSDLRMGGHRIRRALSSDKQIAEEQLGDLIKQRNAARRGEIPQDSSWSAFKAKYLEHSRTTKNPKTYRCDQRALEDLEVYSRPRTVNHVTPELLDRLNTHWIKQGRGLYARNRMIRAIKTAMRKAEAWKYARPMDWRSVKEAKEPKGRLHFHTEPQLKKLIGICRQAPISHLWLTVCLLGSRAGLRREEMFWLEWADVDFRNNRIHIAPKEGWHPKDYERRWIPMAPDLRQHLTQIKEKAQETWVLAQDGPRPSVGGMTTYFKRLTRKAGLVGNVHTLRHTFASHLAQAGVPLYHIAKLMGHSSVKTTEIYAHLQKGDLDSWFRFGSTGGGFGRYETGRSHAKDRR